MRQLILMRHSKTEQPGFGQDDFDRALTDSGRLDAPLVAKSLREAAADPQLVIVSPSLRTQQTWEILSSTFPDCDVEIRPRLYLAPPEVLLEEIEQCDVERLMVLAHNPGIQELAFDLVADDSSLRKAVATKFPTSAAVLFERESRDRSWLARAYFMAKPLRSSDDD